MDNKRDGWQQLSGYLILAAGILLLVAMSQVSGVSAFLTAVEPLASSTGASEVEEVAVVDTAVLTSTQTIMTESSSTEPLPVLQDNSLAPATNPHTYQIKMPAHNFQTHVVTDLDTPNSIAEQYGISSNTLIGGNPNISRESNLLQTGAELIILPVDGVLHTVQPGETLQSIADLYSVSVDDIINYTPNNLEYPFYRLAPEMQLVIPGASVGQFYFTAPKSVGNNAPNQWAVVGTGSYIWPVNGRCLTSYYSGFHPGLDVSTREGSPVYASDTGTVTYAAYAAGTYYDYGNLIVINHGNGQETFYAHLSGINVAPGQIVNQGDLIGSTGNTGRSSGPHLHFEIRQNDYGINPLNRLGGPVQDCS